MILGWIRTLLAEKRLEAMVDKNLKGNLDTDELVTTIKLALKCTQTNPNLRPKMSQVLKILVEMNGQEVPSQGVVDEAFRFAWNVGEALEESSVVIEAIELSGLRLDS